MQNLWIIPILPLVGFAINGIFGRRLSNRVVSAIAVLAVLMAFVKVLVSLMDLGAFSGGLEQTHVEHYFTWIQSGALNISVDFAVDRLSAVMLLIVTGIGTLIHIYAVGYMAHEEGYYRFFSFFNLFMFFMLVLVLAQNYLILFVGWEGVGLCSYLLVGFYLTEKYATDAGNKAFIVNRIGDFGFSLAIFLIAIHFGSLDFTSVFSQAKNLPVEASPGWITAIALLLLVGATGKSAQIPLYVWLPDAMAGPTPVSALIHAATMVTAGIYMIARSSSIFLHSPVALYTVAIIGISTAFFAATVGLVQNDIKKVFAYSTVSQLGYMFVGLGTGAFSAGIFHVMTHAFFKALLFLGAGSVIHALSGEQDLRKMGGLMKKIPITCAVLACASVAIAGVPPFSGAASKDLILEAAYAYAPWIYWVGLVTAGMTAFYVGRAFFMAFFGEYRGDKHPHESPFLMWGPLAVLAALSLGGGFIKLPQYLEPMFPLSEASLPSYVSWLPAVFGVGGILLAYILYVVAPKIPESIANAFRPIYTLFLNKYFIDEAYDSAVVNPVIDGSRSLLWRTIDAGAIDGAVNGVGSTAGGVGSILRRLQSGYIRSYAGWVVAGAILVVVIMGLTGVTR